MSFSGLLVMAHLWILTVHTVEVQHVQLGATVALDCNLSYVYDTAWLKHNPNLPPTLIVFANLRKGDPIYGYQPDPRFSVEFLNRSLTLTISAIEERDLGLYYCVAYLNTQPLIGSGTMLQGPSQSSFYHWYCAVVSCGLLSMGICVCMVHWKTKVHGKTSRSEAQCQRDKNNSSVCTVNIYAASEGGTDQLNRADVRLT